MLKHENTICSGQQAGDIVGSTLARLPKNCIDIIQSSSSSKSDTTKKNVTTASLTKKKPSWKRPSDKPKRPACAYNLYFHLERERLVRGDSNEPHQYTAEDVARAAACQFHDKPKRKHVKTHGKISFRDLSRTIASSWRCLSKEDRAIYERQAAVEGEIYSKRLDAWKAKQQQHQQQQHQHQHQQQLVGTTGLQLDVVMKQHKLKRIPSDLESIDTIEYDSRLEDDSIEMEYSQILSSCKPRGFQSYSVVSDFDEDEITFNHDDMPSHASPTNDYDDGDLLLRMSEEIYHDDLLDVPSGRMSPLAF